MNFVILVEPESFTASMIEHFNLFGTTHIEDEPVREVGNSSFFISSGPGLKASISDTMRHRKTAPQVIVLLVIEHEQ